MVFFFSPWFSFCSRFTFCSNYKHKSLVTFWQMTSPDNFMLLRRCHDFPSFSAIRISSQHTCQVKVTRGRQQTTEARGVIYFLFFILAAMETNTRPVGCNTTVNYLRGNPLNTIHLTRSFSDNQKMNSLTRRKQAKKCSTGCMNNGMYRQWWAPLFPNYLVVREVAAIGPGSLKGSRQSCTRYHSHTCGVWKARCKKTCS